MKPGDSAFCCSLILDDFGVQHGSMNLTLPPCFPMICAYVTLFEFASFANFLGKTCYLTLALWVSHPVKLQSELQELVWILNLQVKNAQRQRLPFGPVQAFFGKWKLLHWSSSSRWNISRIWRSSSSISSFRLTGWPYCLTSVASFKKAATFATFMQSDVTSPWPNQWSSDTS